MAVFVYTDAYLTLNGVELSTKVKTVTLTIDVATQDGTAMGGSGWTTNVPGLKSGSLAITFNDDFASSNVDATIAAALGTSVAFELRPTSSAVGSGNPKWTGNVIINQNVIGGGIGELAAKSVTFPTTGAVTRATS
jgi:hypothetical protein